MKRARTSGAATTVPIGSVRQSNVRAGMLLPPWMRQLDVLGLEQRLVDFDTVGLEVIPDLDLGTVRAARQPHDLQAVTHPDDHEGRLGVQVDLDDVALGAVVVEAALVGVLPLLALLLGQLSGMAPLGLGLDRRWSRRPWRCSGSGRGWSSRLGRRTSW